MWHFNDHRSGIKFTYKNGLFYMPNNVLYNFKTKIIFICCSDTHSWIHVYRKTYTGKLPSPGAIADTSDEKIISNFAK